MALAIKAKASDSQPTQYKYDALGTLVSVVLPDGTRIDYVIDARNRRMEKKVNGVLQQGFLYDGQLRVVAELNASGTMVSQFVYGTYSSSPDLVIKGSSIYRVVHDQLESVRLVVSTADGSVAERLDYDEWGNVLQDSNPAFQPFGFAGDLWDAQTALVRFGARDYDLSPGRWTNKDALRFESGSFNFFSYANNNPVGLRTYRG